MPESEVRKYRPGENKGQLWGGNVSSEPFQQALYTLAKLRGFESQRKLSRALGKKSSGIVGKWYRGISVPSPEEFGRLLILFQPNDEDLDNLVEPYGRLLQEGRGRRSALANSQRAVVGGQKHIKAGLTPFDSWVEEYCKDNMISINIFSRTIGIGEKSLRHVNLIGLNSFSHILQKAPEALNLSEHETDALSEAVARALEDQLLNGRKFKYNPRLEVRLIREQLACKTYSNSEVGRELGVSKERVRQLKIEFDLPYILTGEHLDILRNRGKQRSRMKKSQ